MISLHLPTLVAALLVGYLMLTLELGWAQRGLRARPELRRWTWGSWAVLAGLLWLAARPLVPLAWSVVLGNGLMCMGLVLYHHAFHWMLSGAVPRRPLWRWWALAILVLVAAAQWPAPWRNAVVSWLYLGFVLPTLWLLWRSSWRERSRRSLLITLFVAAVALAFRGVHALWAPEQYVELFQASWGQGITFLTAFMALLGAGFGFVLAVFERVANEMEVMASHDGLTGCLNRTTTDALLAHALARGRRDGTPLSFVLLDLDNFKLVNDRHGHRVGDDALRHFAEAARQRLRHADVLGRTGGEEFGLVLPATDGPGACRLVDDIRVATAAIRVPDGQGGEVSITVSAGVATFLPGEPLSADRLYGRADQALYEAKRAGRNQVVLYGDSNPRQAALIA